MNICVCLGLNEHWNNGNREFTCFWIRMEFRAILLSLFTFTSRWFGYRTLFCIAQWISCFKVCFNVCFVQKSCKLFSLLINTHFIQTAIHMWSSNIIRTVRLNFAIKRKALCTINNGLPLVTFNEFTFRMNPQIPSQLNEFSLLKKWILYYIFAY
jgi:hypothetical protein